MSERQARQAARFHCRGCSRPTLHPFFGWVTEDARENTIRPRAFYRTCGGCGLVVMVLADVTDAEGIARVVLDEHLRRLGGAATATSAPVGPPPTDWEAALQWGMETLWTLYSTKWDPAFGDGGVGFRAYSIGTLRKRLPRWIQEENGEPSERSKGRVHPKPHAPSVSTSLDQLLDPSGSTGGDGNQEGRHAVGRSTDDLGPMEAAFAGRIGDFADDRSPDLAWALSARRRG